MRLSLRRAGALALIGAWAWLWYRIGHYRGFEDSRYEHEHGRFFR
jgi:hypothetical protein